MSLKSYSLGAPIWAHAEWTGSLYRPGSKASEYLEQYASVFNSVEGNTTFYATPSADTMLRWLDRTPEGFEFCLKLPRIITHEIRLRQHAWLHTDRFLEALSPLHERLGPFLLQLPPSFSGAEFGVLQQFIERLPREFNWALEVRHQDYFGEAPMNKQLNVFLSEQGVNRVIFDTRGAFESDPRDPMVRLAQSKKPVTQWKVVSTGARPFVRYCGRPNPSEGHDDDRLCFWALQFASWIRDGRRPLFFAHTPGDLRIPELATRFHQALSAHLDVGTIPRFPGEKRQMSLF